MSPIPTPQSTIFDSGLCASDHMLLTEVLIISDEQIKMISHLPFQCFIYLLMECGLE